MFVGFNGTQVSAMSKLLKVSYSPPIAQLFRHSKACRLMNYATEQPPHRSTPAIETLYSPSRRRQMLSPMNYATESHKPPPTPKESPVEVFSSTSRPQPYYAKHPPIRELPRIKKRWPVILSAVVAGLAGWAAFMAYVTNQEKISSSVVRQIMRSVREDPQLKELLGVAIRPQPEWWLNGDPMIHGRISQLQGNVDVSFRIKGSKGSGTLYFTSIRKEKGVPFTILRFKVIGDEGSTILVDAKPT